MNNRIGIRDKDAVPFDVSPVEQALSANLELQAALQSELERVADAKATNRATAARLSRQLLDALRPQAPSEPTTNNEPLPKSKSKAQPSKAAPSSAVDVKRKWNRRFFYDGKSRQREPHPNPDTVQRRAIEARYFFHHLQPPWSKKESDALMSAVSECCGTGAEQATSVSTDSIDFAAVAATMQQSRKKGDTTLPRSELECRIHYEHVVRQKNFIPFTKPELETISAKIQQAASAGQATSLSWDDLAHELSTPNLCRTAWDCLVAYHTKIKSSPQFNSTSPVWTVYEDELLLKFLAAAGPQTVVDSKNALVQFTILNQLIPTKPKKQIFDRINKSLLNPNLKRSEWSEIEERRLAIFMKIYHRPATDAKKHEPSAFRPDLYLASTHCHGRTIKSVADKWNRTINPDYSSRPFTSREDQELMRVLRLSPHAGMGWTELSQKHFPDRHPQRLLSRWSELATDDDILRRERALQAAVGPVAKNRKRPLTETVDPDEAMDNGDM